MPQEREPPRTLREALGWQGAITGAADLVWVLVPAVVTWLFNRALDATGRGDGARLIELAIGTPILMALAPVTSRQVATLKSLGLGVTTAAALGLVNRAVGVRVAYPAEAVALARPTEVVQASPPSWGLAMAA